MPSLVGVMVLGCAAQDEAQGEDPAPMPGLCENLDPDERFRDPLVHVAEAEHPKTLELVDVVATPSRVFACGGLGGLTIWEVSDAAEPRVLATGVGPIYQPSAGFPRCTHVAADPARHRVLITHRGDEALPTSYLQVYDIADPTAPATIDSWSSGTASLEGVAIAGDRVYVAAHDDGIAHFRLDEDGLQAVGSFADDRSDGWKPVLIGDHLVVAEGRSGLRTYDVSGGVPAPLATLELPGSSRDVVVRDGRAYVATAIGLAIVDIGDLRNPELVTHLETPGTSSAVAMGRGDIVLVADWNQVRGYDVADPAAPRQILTESVPVPTEVSRVLAIDASSASGRVTVGEWRTMHTYRQELEAVGPDLQITPDPLLFGRVPPGEAADRVLVLRNAGNRAARIRDVVADAADLTVGPRSLCIDAGKSAALEVEFAPSTDAMFQEPVVIESNDPDRPFIAVRVAANEPGIDMGDPMPEIDLIDLEGNRWSNADLEGHVVLLAYFATF